jgi:hypothetical protein
MIKFNNNNHIEEQEGYTLIHQEQVEFDEEKGYVDMQLIYKENNTDLLWMVEYTDKGSNGAEYTSWPKQVKEYTKTVKYYK